MQRRRSIGRSGEQASDAANSLSDVFTGSHLPSRNRASNRAYGYNAGPQFGRFCGTDFGLSD
jgi:hypothetical protein